MITNDDLSFVEPTGAFASSGTKTEPDETKRSTGYIENEGFPFENANYYLNELTTNDLNDITALTNIINELINVLTLKSVTPSASSEVQLSEFITDYIFTNLMNYRTGSREVLINAYYDTDTSSYKRIANGCAAMFTFSTTYGLRIYVDGNSSAGEGIAWTSILDTYGETSFETVLSHNLKARYLKNNVGILPNIEPYLKGLEGSAFSLTAGTRFAISYCGSQQINLLDTQNHTINRYEWDGDEWALLGSSDAGGDASGYCALISLSSTVCIGVNEGHDGFRAYTWNGSSYSYGSVFDLGTVTYPALCAVSATNFVYVDSNDEELEMYSYSGGTYTLIGAAYSTGAIGNPAICKLYDPAYEGSNKGLIAFVDTGTHYLKVYGFNGATWSVVYSGINLGTIGNVSIASVSDNIVAIIDATNAIIKFYYWDGVTFALIGNTLTLSSIGTPAFTAMKSSQLVFVDNTNDELRTYGIDWIPLTPVNRIIS